jgi:outer membrane protein assembly factor BamB/Ca2+-binding EF-hand superfamily protein
MSTNLRAAALIAALGFASTLSAEVPSGPGDWPQWRGPNRTNLSTETGLAREWPEAGPPLLWQVDSVGVGYSSLAVKDGLIVTQGDIDGVEHIICLKAADGSTVWAVQPAPVAAELDAKIAVEKKRLDKDADGTIDEAEALSGIGPDFFTFDHGDAKADAKAIAAERTARLMKLLDTDKDGKLSAAETAGRFRQQFSKIDKADKSADAAALAEARTADVMKADKDGDGKLSRKESQGTAAQEPFGRADVKDPATNKADEQLTTEELTAFFKKNEAGQDGLLTAEELTNYYAESQAGRDGILTDAEMRGYYGGYRNSFGDGPRGTPTIDGKVVYVEGGNGDLTCLELATGKTIWHKNLAKDFGGGRPGWGYSESPLIEGDWVIVTPGGAKGTLAALNKHTGETVWRSTDVEPAHYASPQVAEIAGERMVVQFAQKNVFGVRLKDGELLWTYSKANNGTANASTPIIRGDYIYASSGYGTGGGLCKVSKDGDKFKAEEVYFDKALQSHHGGVILLGEYIYGFSNNALICQDFLTGKEAWKARSVSKGSLTYADGLLFLLGEGHQVALAEALPEGYTEKGRFKIDNFGRQSWAHPVVAGGKLYIRNMHRLSCYDVRGK